MPTTPTRQSVGINQLQTYVNSHGEETTINAAHIHFRERLGPLQTYHCHTCDDRFQANSLLNVMEHFVRHNRSEKKSSAFHSVCLYCGGKVHSYCLETRSDGGTGAAVVEKGKVGWTAVDPGTAGGGRRYYHDCVRSRTGLDT